MNYLDEYIAIFNTTTKWDRRERESLIQQWSLQKNILFPQFEHFISAFELGNDVYFTADFHHSLTFPFLKEEIEQNNLEAVRLLYDLNLDKEFMKYLKRDDALFAIGLSITPSDTQMLYEKFLYSTQLLENSVKDTNAGIYYKDHLATQDELNELILLKNDYVDLCNTLRKNTMRTSQLISKLNEQYPL